MSSNTSKPLVIAVDGPAASGKGTLAKRIAEHFRLHYLDTGCIYRAVGLAIMNDGKDPQDKATAIAYASALTPEDVSSDGLYHEGVGNAASIVAAIPEVRSVLFAFQREVAGKPEGAVLDGRDIGTVICPDATFKFFITADLETRTKRRYKQLQTKDKSIIHQTVLDDLKRRDQRDSERAVAPLQQAEDAIRIDTTHMNAQEVLETVLSHISHQRESVMQ